MIIIIPAAHRMFGGVKKGEGGEVSRKLEWLRIKGTNAIKTHL